MSDTRRLTAGLSLSSLGFGLLRARAYIALVVIIAVFAMMSPNYLTPENLLVMSRHVAVYAILALGMLMVILNGGIDLSVGSTVALSGVTAGFLLQGVPLAGTDVIAYPPVWVVVLASLGIGAVVGMINGLLISRLRVPSFVATLGMLYVVRGAALLITNGNTYPDLAGDPALGNTGFEFIGFKSIVGIPTGVVVMVFAAIIASIVLNRTPYGRWLYASGGNERAAELSGVPVKRVQRSVYVIAGVLAAVVGLIIASELTSATPQAGDSFELTAIAAVVIGGADLKGGKGTVRGTMLGAFVIGFLADGLVIVGVSQYWQMVFKGGVIILAVILNFLERKNVRPVASTTTLLNRGASAPPETRPTHEHANKT